MTARSSVAELEAFMPPDTCSASPPSATTCASRRLDSTNRLVTHHGFKVHDIPLVVSLYQGSRLSQRAAALVQRAYGRLGYDYRRSINSSLSGVSLEANLDGRTVGTLSITLDSLRGIQAQELYVDEIRPYRQLGPLCEFTRLAIDTPRGGHEVLCSLFYVAYVYAHLLFGASQLFIEVNPRHARFYERMLGFRPIGDVKTCPRVKAPAVLLHLDFSHTREQIQRARLTACNGTSKLYYYAAPLDEEVALLQRIRTGLLC